MAAHDPDPSIQRKQLELKLGRQKKIQMIDGQQVEVMPGIGSEEEEEIDMMAVEGSDGQQYVVLEVIHVADGEEQTMVVSDGTGDLLGETILPDNGQYNIYIMNGVQDKNITLEKGSSSSAFIAVIFWSGVLNFATFICLCYTYF